MAVKPDWERTAPASSRWRGWAGHGRIPRWRAANHCRCYPVACICTPECEARRSVELVCRVWRGRRDPRAMSRAPLRGRAKLGALPDDLYDYLQTSAPHVGRPARHDFSCWQVVDDWPETVPIYEAELDLLEAHFGDRLDDLFGAKRA